MAEFEGYSIQWLQDQTWLLQDKLEDAEEADLAESTTATQNAVRRAKKRLNGLYAAIKAKNEAAEAKPVEPKPNSTMQPSETQEERLNREKERAARNAMSDEVDRIGVFVPGMEVAVFLAKAENCYQLHVKKCPSIEPDFVVRLKGRLSDDFKTTLWQSNVATDTYKDFVSYMKTQHETRASAFQLVERFAAVEIREGESYLDYARRIEAKGIDMQKSLDLKFEKSNPKPASAQETIVMDRHQLRRLMEGTFVLQTIHRRNPEVYDFILADLDECWSATDIALKATVRTERAEAKSTVAAAANFAKPAQGNQSNQNVAEKPLCDYLLKFGRCTQAKSGRCRRNHDEAEAAKKRQFFGIKVEKSRNGRNGGKPRGRDRRRTDNRKFAETANHVDGEAQENAFNAVADFELQPAQVFQHGLE